LVESRLWTQAEKSLSDRLFPERISLFYNISTQRGFVFFKLHGGCFHEIILELRKNKTYEVENTLEEVMIRANERKISKLPGED